MPALKSLGVLSAQPLRRQIVARQLAARIVVELPVGSELRRPSVDLPGEKIIRLAEALETDGLVIDVRQRDQPIDRGERQSVFIGHAVERGPVLDFVAAQLPGPAGDEFHHIEGRADHCSVCAIAVADRMGYVGVIERAQHARFAQDRALASRRRNCGRPSQDHGLTAAIEADDHIGGAAVNDLDGERRPAERGNVLIEPCGQPRNVNQLIEIVACDDGHACFARRYDSMSPRNSRNSSASRLQRAASMRRKNALAALRAQESALRLMALPRRVGESKGARL